MTFSEYINYCRNIVLGGIFLLAIAIPLIICLTLMILSFICLCDIFFIIFVSHNYIKILYELLFIIFTIAILPFPICWLGYSADELPKRLFL